MLYYYDKRAKPCLITYYKHKGCGAFESCTYSGMSNKLGSTDLGDGFITIYTCTRNSLKVGVCVLSIVLVLVLIMFGVSYFINKQGMRVKAT